MPHDKQKWAEKRKGKVRKFQDDNDSEHSEDSEESLMTLVASPEEVEYSTWDMFLHRRVSNLTQVNCVQLRICHLPRMCLESVVFWVWSGA